MNPRTDAHDVGEVCADRRDHCYIHHVDEPSPPGTYRWCSECGHVFPTAEALLADNAAVVEELNARPLPPPFGSAEPLIPATDPDKVTACPHCAHDF